MASHLQCAACGCNVSANLSRIRIFEEHELRAARRQRMFCHRVTSCGAHKASLVAVGNGTTAGQLLANHSQISCRHRGRSDDGDCHDSCAHNPQRCADLPYPWLADGGPAFYRAGVSAQPDHVHKRRVGLPPSAFEPLNTRLDTTQTLKMSRHQRPLSFPPNACARDLIQVRVARFCFFFCAGLVYRAPQDSGQAGIMSGGATKACVRLWLSQNREEMHHCFLCVRTFGSLGQATLRYYDLCYI
jgi:hypothetical protein